MRPTLQTDRLILRPFTAADADAIVELVGDREIASNTLSIPHPYDRSVAEKWLATHEDAYARGQSVVFAVTDRASGTLIGCVGLVIERDHRRAELGYWIGVRHWRKGYCTEAAQAVMRHGFDTLGLHRLFAHHLTRNPASGRVMQKLGMRHEGTLHGHVLKWGVHEDLELYGVVKEDYARTLAALA